MRGNPTALALLLTVSISAPASALSAGPCKIAEGDVDRCIDTHLDLPTKRTRDSNELVAVLRVLDSCEQWVQITLVQRDPSAEVKATAEVASTDSIAQQLCELRRLHPKQDLEVLCENVVLHKAKSKLSSTNELRSRIDALRNLDISPILEPEVFVHGVTYNLWFFSVFSESEFHFYGPARPTGPRPSLESWARETLALFETGCAQANSELEGAKGQQCPKSGAISWRWWSSPAPPPAPSSSRSRPSPPKRPSSPVPQSRPATASPSRPPGT